MARLEQVHAAGDGGAQGDGVHAVLVAEEVGLEDGLQVVDAAVRAHAPGGFVLGSLTLAQVLGVGDLGHPAAADHAGVAALGTHQQLVGQGLPAHLVGGREVAVPEVVGGQRPGLVEDVDQDVGAVGLEPGAPHGVQADALPGLVHGGHETLGIGHLHRPGAHHHHGLEVLGAHDGAHPGAAGGAVHLVHDGREQHQLLPGGPDAGHLGLLVGLGAQQVHRLGHQLAPQVGGVPELRVVVLDPQVDGPGRLVLEDDQVVARVLQFRPERAAGVGGGDGAGEGSLGDHVVAPAGRGEGARVRPRREDQLVFGRQGIHLRVHFVAEDPGAQPAGADVLGRQVRAGRLPGDGAGGQVHTENAATPTEHGHASWKAALNLAAKRFLRERVEMLSSTNSRAALGQNRTHSGLPPQVFALEDAAAGGVVGDVAERAGHGAHAAADALVAFVGDHLGALGPVQGAGGADLGAGCFLALLAHHGHREALPLPGVDVHPRAGGPELPFVAIDTGQGAVMASRAFVRMNH